MAHLTTIRSSTTRLLQGRLAPALALTAGIAIYALTRESPPESIYLLRALLGFNTADHALVALPFAGQLPSFFHTMALMLATNGLTRHHLKQRRVAKAIMLISALAMEFVQADSVQSAVNTLVVWNMPVPDYLTTYISAGTFDVLDLIAIAAATLITSRTIIQFMFRTPLHYKD